MVLYLPTGKHTEQIDTYPDKVIKKFKLFSLIYMQYENIKYA